MRLFGPLEYSRIPLRPASASGSVLTTEDSDSLIRPVQFWETSKATGSMSACKAPGPDGFNPLFYHKYWNIIGPSVHLLVQKAFAIGHIDTELNSTLLVLIPKIGRPESIKQFRPISLCNVIYKVITKVLVNRLKNCIGKLVNPLQASFVPGRHAVDNIIMAQEMVHSIRRSKAKNGGMMLKVDLEKAYDHVNWDFLMETLELFGFPASCLRLIKNCISTSTLAVLWNGEKTDTFHPSRGLRQGDPLSPYLVLYLERLSRLVAQAVELKRWKTFEVCRGGPIIPRLFFADDLLFFAKANLSQASVVQEIVQSFCQASGQRVSVDKSIVFVSP